MGYAFGRKIWEKHRKARANELDDNYDYTKEDSDDKLSDIINNNNFRNRIFVEYIYYYNIFDLYIF